MRDLSNTESIQKLMKAFEKIPGGEIVSKGLRDIAHAQYDTVEALLVFMASPRLHFLGFNIPDYPKKDAPTQINQRLYQLLQKNTSDPFSQYKALQRRLNSFCRIIES